MLKPEASLIALAIFPSSLALADGLGQQAYLKPLVVGSGDEFSTAIDASGNTLVIGARLEDSSATGIDGNAGNNDLSDSGAVYVFVTDGSTWTQQAYIKSSNPDVEDRFGSAIAIDGDTLVVGAETEDSGATGVGGDELDGSAEQSGAVYVFVRSGSTWTQQAYLKASNTGAGDQFGCAVDVSGDTIVVGACFEDSNATGVNGDEDNELAAVAGAAYVFERSGTTWTQQAYLKASNTEGGDLFGSAVAISGNTIVVGAEHEDSDSTGIDGDEGNNLTTFAGAVYVFERSGANWSQQAYIKASNTGTADRFGQAVDISNDTIVVGVRNEDSNATGIDGDASNDLALGSGAAYVFTRTGGSWAQQAYLKASNTDPNDRFGSDVSIDGNTILIGAPREESSATFGAGGEGDNGTDDAGATYVFERSGASWSQTAYLKASNTEVETFFGSSVAVAGQLIAVAAVGDDSASPGVNGDQDSNAAMNSGAVHVFDLAACDPPPSITESCNGDGGDQLGCTDCPCGNNTAPSTLGGCLNSSGAATRLLTVGAPSVSTGALRFLASGAPSMVSGVLVSGASLAPANPANPCFGQNSGLQSTQLDGLRCVVQGVLRHGVRPTDANGDIGMTTNGWGTQSFNFGVFFSGVTRHFQIVHRDDQSASCMTGQNTSQSLTIVFGP